jgi:hypothetical protein
VETEAPAAPKVIEAERWQLQKYKSRYHNRRVGRSRK